jgi:3'-phosphoadenosine 5'-phosphosulfate sulfotransferase (PAPS reductase)/FAD synthetase
VNPYRIEGPAEIGFSGGRSSAYMLRHILDAHGGELPSDVHVGFQNTGKERPETLDFIHQCSTRWSVPVTWLEYHRTWGQPEDQPAYRVVSYETASRNGEPFRMMLDYYRQYREEVKDAPPILPNPVNRMCTSYLKIRVAKQWMQSFGYEAWDAVIGIRADEPKRYTRMSAANGRERWENVMPMYEAGVSKEDVNAFWSAQDFDLGIDSDLGNCDLCFLKHENKIYRALQVNPELGDWWIEQEERTGQRFRKDRPGYKEMKWVAVQMNKQIPMFGTVEEESLADCICGE